MSARDVACPYCGAEPREHCIETLADGSLRRLTSPHVTRWIRGQDLAAYAPPAVPADGAGGERDA